MVLLRLLSPDTSSNRPILYPYIFFCLLQLLPVCCPRVKHFMRAISLNCAIYGELEVNQLTHQNEEWIHENPCEHSWFLPVLFFTTIASIETLVTTRASSALPCRQTATVGHAPTQQTCFSKIRVKREVVKYTRQPIYADKKKYIISIIAIYARYQNDFKNLSHE